MNRAQRDFWRLEKAHGGVALIQPVRDDMRKARRGKLEQLRLSCQRWAACLVYLREVYIAADYNSLSYLVFLHHAVQPQPALCPKLFTVKGLETPRYDLRSASNNR